MKKFLHELDQVKTPDGWAEDVIEMTKNMSPDEKEKMIQFYKKKVTFKVMVLVAAIVTLSSASIFAAYRINQTYKTQNTAQSLNHFDTSVDANGNQYTYDGGQAIDQSKASNNLNVTCTKMSAEAHSAYIQFSVATKDGSSLAENSDFKVSITARQTFQNVVVKVDDQIIASNSIETFYHLQRVDDTSQPDKALLELNIQTNKIDLTGKNISVSLENYQDEWYEYEDIGFKYASIAELAKQGILASEDDFLPSDKVKYSLNSGMKLLNAGSNKIYFSDKYPEAYIDNMGFAPIDFDSDECFYITIVPGSEENAKALQKIEFQNMITGMPNTDRLMSQTKSGQSWVVIKETLPDGRIEIALDVSRDPLFSPGGRKNIDTTIENMSNYTFKYNKSSEVKTKDIRYSGNWAFDFNVNADMMNSEINKDVNVSVTETRTNSQTIIVNHVDLTTSKLNILASIVNLDTWSFKEFPISGPISSPYIILKDGTKISAGDKVDGSSQDGSSTVSYGWYLPSLLDPAQVKSVEWYGVSIDLQ